MSGEHRDFSEAESEAIARFVAVSFAERPARRGDALLLDQGAAPLRTTRTELAAHLRSSGMSALARRVERLEVPAGVVVALIVGDEGARVVPINAEEIAVTGAIATPRPAVFAVPAVVVQPAAPVAGFGTRGRFVGGAA